MTIDSTLTRYNPDEVNGLTDPAAYYAEMPEFMTLGELVAAGGKVTRVRLLTEYRHGLGRICDLSYIHGTLPDGRRVSVTHTPTLGYFNRVSYDLVEWAKEYGVYAKGCGLLDRANWSWM